MGVAASNSYIEENNIDPYKILDIDPDSNEETIKKAYKRKSRKIHPDKTNGKTELEFKILGICYKYAIDKLNIYKTKLPSELKQQSNQELVYEDSRDFHSINWNDQQTREKFFYGGNTGGLRFDTHSELVNQKVSGPINYSDVQQKSYKNIFGEHEGYNRDKFNAAFELQTTHKKKISSHQGNPEAIEANSSLSPLFIETHGGLIIEHDTSYIKPISYLEYEENSDFNADDISNLSQKEMNKIIKNTKRDTSHFSKKKMSKMLDSYNSDRSTVKIDTTRTFQENKAFLYESHINDMREESERNQKNIIDRLSIYPQNVRNQYLNNQLQDSSSVLFGDQLNVPKGIRKK